MSDARHPQGLLELAIDQMPVPNRPRRWLRRAGIRTVGELLAHTEADLLTIQNFGRTSLEHVRRFLKQHDLHLKPDDNRNGQLAPQLVEQALGDRSFPINRRERQILRLRYGVGHHKPRTLQQIGQRIGLTRERVRQIQKQAEQKVLARQTLQHARDAEPVKAVVPKPYADYTPAQ